MSNLYEDLEWCSLKSCIGQQYIQFQQEKTVSVYAMVQGQGQLMEEIKDKIKRSRFKQSINNMEVLPIDSDLSNISSHYNYGEDESLIKNKFTEQFELSQVNSALKEVKDSCSAETYETVKNYVLNSKQKECQNLGKTLEKKNKELEEFSLAIIMKQNQIAQLKQQISPYLTKADFLEDQKKKWKKKNDQLTQKEVLLHKMQRALIFKQKMHQQAKKRVQKLKEFTNSIYTKMSKIQSDLNNLRVNIQLQMTTAQKVSCCSEGNEKCWKKEVMGKYRQKLLEERSILKEEQRHLQKRYQMLENVSQQCKQLVSQSYEGLLPIGGGSAVHPNSKYQRLREGPVSMMEING